MKLVFLFLLLLLSPLLVTSRPAAETQDAVLDTDGNPVQRGRQYYVRPRNEGNGGGLKMFRLQGTCPQILVQKLSEEKNGQPIMIFPEEHSDDQIVRVSDRLYILFPRPTPCPQSTQWQVNGAFVTAGGTVSSNDPHNSLFAIFKSRAGDGYKIRSCPRRTSTSWCLSLGVHEANGQRFLSLRGENKALEFVFQRVREESSQTAEAQEAILDTNGNPVQRGRQYHVLPKNKGNGGGLKMSRLQGSCPQNVVQKLSEEKNGQPIMIFPEEQSDDRVVRESDRVYILFPRPTPCPQSTQWQVNEQYVTTGGTVSSNDPHNSRFAIFKSRAGGYEIRSCPRQRSTSRCSTLGVEESNNGQRLVSVRPQNEAFEFVFQRANEEESNLHAVA